MRRLVLGLFLSLFVLVGCSTPIPPVELSPAAPTLPPTLPSATQAAEPTLAPTSPPGPPAATAAPTVPIPTAAPTAGSAPGAFVSSRLGISFNFLPNQAGATFAVQESGDKVYVYNTQGPATQGQWVQVFSKAPNQSLVDAINAQVLKGYSLQDCIATQKPSPNVGAHEPATFVFATIDLPRSANDDMQTLQAKAAKCPQPYAAVGGLAYFVADTAHPDRFAFFSIGQYGIMGANNQPWQTTLQFIGPASGGGALTGYQDDRSTARSLLQSYVNAINRKEYLRAYSYWEANAPGLAPYPQFKQGYANTASVQLTVGTVTSGAAAGNVYYDVPVVLTAQTTGGQQQFFFGCYLAHLPQPANFGAPPIQPLAIQQAAVQQVPNKATADARLAAACAGSGHEGQPVVEPTPNPGDISAGRYLDDRSNAVQVLRSLFNAINSKQYVRAYSYWEANAPGLAPYPQFAQGYANTVSVQLTTGTVSSDAGAGQLYFRVPVTLIAQTTGGVQTFVGCYTLHLSQPAIQDTPPFRPLAISGAKVSQVANNANTASLMSQACAQ